MPSPPLAERAPLRRADLCSIYVAAICTGAGQTFYFAILPPLGRELRLSELEIGSIIAIASFVYMIAAPFWGRVSDRWGRRRVFLFGLFWYAALTTVFGLVASAGLAGWLVGTGALLALTAVRILFATMAGSAHPAAQAYIADSTSEARRTQAIGLIGAAFGIGTVAGPGAAALLSAYGLVTPIFVISAAVFAAWIFALRSVRRLPESPSGGARRFFFPRRTLKLLAIGALLFSMMAAIQQATGFRVQDTQDATAEETAQLAGLALSGAAIAAVLAQAGLIQVLRWSPKRLLLLGAFAGSAGGVVLALSAEYGTIVLGVSLMGLAFGLMNPAYTAGLTLTATAAEQGSVAGLNGMVQGVGYVAGPLIGGGLYQVAPTLPFTTCAILMAIALMIAIPLKIGR